MIQKSDSSIRRNTNQIHVHVIWRTEPIFSIWRIEPIFVFEESFGDAYRNEFSAFAANPVGLALGAEMMQQNYVQPAPVPQPNFAFPGQGVGILELTNKNDFSVDLLMKLPTSWRYLFHV